VKHRIYNLVTFIARIAVLLATTGPVLAIDLTGQASVIDGDTIEIHGARIRLWGIDAPESTQLCRGEDSLQYRCGAKAANDLDGFIARRPVSCTPISLDQYGRTVATCTVDSTDLGKWLVSNGLALDWPNYSRGMYDKIQREVVGQLRRAVALSGLHPGGRPAGRMFGRRERASLKMPVRCNRSDEKIGPVSDFIATEARFGAWNYEPQGQPIPLDQHLGQKESGRRSKR
jgi:endonuclease YncB( thermonuclease family)